MVPAEHLLLCRRLGFWYVTSWVTQWASLVDNTRRVFSQLMAGGLKHILCDSTGRGPWKLEPWFSWTLSHMPFTCTDYDCLWRPVSPQSDSPNWQWSWEALGLTFPWSYLPPALPGWSWKSREPHNCPFKLFNWANSLVIFSGGFPRTKINRIFSYSLGCANMSALYDKELPLCERQICESWIMLSNSFFKILRVPWWSSGEDLLLSVPWPGFNLWPGKWDSH